MNNIHKINLKIYSKFESELEYMKETSTVYSTYKDLTDTKQILNPYSTNNHQLNPTIKFFNKHLDANQYSLESEQAKENAYSNGCFMRPPSAFVTRDRIRRTTNFSNDYTISCNQDTLNMFSHQNPGTSIEFKDNNNKPDEIRDSGFFSITSATDSYRLSGGESFVSVPQLSPNSSTELKNANLNLGSLTTVVAPSALMLPEGLSQEMKSKAKTQKHIQINKVEVRLSKTTPLLNSYTTQVNTNTTGDSNNNNNRNTQKFAIDNVIKFEEPKVQPKLKELQHAIVKSEFKSREAYLSNTFCLNDEDLDVKH